MDSVQFYTRCKRSMISSPCCSLSCHKDIVSTESSHVDFWGFIQICIKYEMHIHTYKCEYVLFLFVIAHFKAQTSAFEWWESSSFLSTGNTVFLLYLFRTKIHVHDNSQILNFNTILVSHCAFYWIFCLLFRCTLLYFMCIIQIFLVCWVHRNTQLNSLLPSTSLFEIHYQLYGICNMVTMLQTHQSPL